MALDGLIEIALRVVAEVIIVGIFYWPGWLLLRIITVGRYPPPIGKPHDQMAVGSFGFCVFPIVLILCIPGARQ